MLHYLPRVGVFVHSVATGADIGHDTLGGYFGNLNEQVCCCAAKLLLHDTVMHLDLIHSLLVPF